jgi:hypothetical protein
MKIPERSDRAEVTILPLPIREPQENWQGRRAGQEDLSRMQGRSASLYPEQEASALIRGA